MNHTNLLVDDTQETTCKGVFWRVTEARYIDSRNAINIRKKYTPLKRISCHGCETCGWIYYDLQESNVDFVDDVSKDGDMVTFCITNEHRDWETGIIDSWDLKVVVI